jgi:NDP-4-keto-2,6-dideoxyhexose 3-C-methyltransferase
MITRTSCRVCDGPFEPVLSLGEQYVSNFLKPGESDGTKAPLDLMLCQQCSLLQLRHTVPANAMYANYWYRSGTNQTMRVALADITRSVERIANLEEGNVVLDIGCNDGTLLSSYKTEGLFRIGFDPATNLTAVSERIADWIIADFFTAERYGIATGRPRIVTSIAMFYDLEDPNKFVSDVKRVMHPDGIWVIQMSYLPSMLKQHDFGNICHEHLEYYSLTSLEYLLARHNMIVSDVELNDINGGSFRVYVRNKDAKGTLFSDPTYRKLANGRVNLLRTREINRKLKDIDTYLSFATWVKRIGKDVSHFIYGQVMVGKKVAVYGASTKGNVMLQYFGLNSEHIIAASERNPDKWGLETVGTRIPIVSEEEARTMKPDYMLVLPWHFLEEFKEREKDYLMNGGRFIVPLPHFTLI